MRRLLIRLMSWLANAGLARRWSHVEAGERLHVVGAATDPAGGPLEGATVVVEVAPPGPRRARAAAIPVQFTIASTAPDGRVDAAADLSWSYHTEDLAAPTRMTVVLMKPGFNEARVDFASAALAVVGGIMQLDFGVVRMTPI